MNLIQKKFTENLKKNNVDKLCQKLDINFLELFIALLQNQTNNPYEFYTWVIKLSSAVGLHTAINHPGSISIQIIIY